MFIKTAKRALMLLGILFLLSCSISYAIPTHIQQDNFRIASVKDFSGLEIDTIQCLGSCEALFKVDNYDTLTATRDSAFKFDFSNSKVKVSDVQVYRDVPYTAYDVVTKQEERTCAKSLNGSYCQNDCRDGAVINGVCHYNVTVTTTKPRTAQRKEWVSLGYATKSGVVAIPKSSTEWVKVFFSVPLGSSGKFNLTLGHGVNQIVLDPWWNSSWNYSRNITITENATTARINDNIHITFPAVAKAKSQADCDDIRVVCGMDSTPYEIPSYIPYCPAGAEDVEVKLPLNVSAGGYNSSCAFYYGNTLVGAPSYTEPAWQPSAVQYVVDNVTKGYAGAGLINYTLRSGIPWIGTDATNRWDSSTTTWNSTVNITWGIVDLRNVTFDIYNITYGGFDWGGGVYRGTPAAMDIACGIHGNGTDSTYTTIYNESIIKSPDTNLGNVSINITADNQSTCQFLRFHIQNISDPPNVGSRFIMVRMFIYGHKSYNYTVGAEVIAPSGNNPSLLSVNITPPSPNILQSLNCTAAINTDTNTSILANFTWFKNDVLNATWTDNSLEFTNMTARGSSAGKTPYPEQGGSKWQCEISFWNEFTVAVVRTNSTAVYVWNETNISLNAPVDGVTSMSDNITINFSVDTFHTLADIDVYLNSTLNYSISLGNGTTDEHDFTHLLEGCYNIGIVTNTTLNNVTACLVFINVTNVSYDGVAYEVSPDHRFNITVISIYSVSNVTLNYTSLDNYSLANYTATNWSVTGVTTPLIFGATETHNFSYNYVVTTPTHVITHNTSKYTQILNEAYSITSLRVNVSEVIEGGSVNVTISIRNYSTGGPIKMYAGYNVTNYTVGVRNHSDSAIDYYIIFNTTLVTTDIGINISSFGNVSYLGRSKIISITNTSVLIRNIQLTTVCAGLPAVLIFKAWDEEANHTHLGDFNSSYGNVTVAWDWRIDVWINSGDVSTFSNTTNQRDNLTICLSPADATLHANISLIFNVINYSQREFHLIDYTINGTLINHSVYTVNDSLTSLISLYIEDDDGRNVEDAVVYVQRYFYDEGNWTNIAVMVSDTLGQVASYLVANDVYYRFRIYQGGNLAESIEPMLITSSSFTFTIGAEITNVLTYLRNIGVECNYNNNTKIVQCNVSDSSGQMEWSELIVKEFKFFGNNTICVDKQYGTTVSLECNISGAVVSTEQYIWTVYVSGSVLPIFSGSIVTVGGATFADIGIFVSIGMVMTLGGIALWNPIIGIIGAIVAVIFSVYLNFINISIGALAGLIIVALILIFKMRGS